MMITRNQCLSTTGFHESAPYCDSSDCKADSASSSSCISNPPGVNGCFCHRDCVFSFTFLYQPVSRRKGKVKLPLFYKGKRHEAYLSHVKVQITASRKDIYLVLVYGITDQPMMLATNKEIKSKDDVIKIAKLYFSRWRIEEYFRCKKQMFQFENFRVRKLKAINALNFYITLCMAFLAHISMKPETNALKVAIIKTADPIKVKISFCYYRLAKGISGILSWQEQTVSLWYRTADFFLLSFSSFLPEQAVVLPAHSLS